MGKTKASDKWKLACTKVKHMKNEMLSTGVATRVITRMYNKKMLCLFIFVNEHYSGIEINYNRKFIDILKECDISLDKIGDGHNIGLFWCKNDEEFNLYNEVALSNRCWTPSTVPNQEIIDTVTSILLFKTIDKLTLMYWFVTFLCLQCAKQSGTYNVSRCVVMQYTIGAVFDFRNAYACGASYDTLKALYNNILSNMVLFIDDEYTTSYAKLIMKKIRGSDK